MSHSQEAKAQAIEIIKENRQSYRAGISPEKLASLFLKRRGSGRRSFPAQAHYLVGQIREDLGDFGVITIDGTYIVPEKGDERLVREFAANRVQFEGTHVRRTKKTLYVASKALESADFELAADTFGLGEKQLELGLRRIGLG